ncbi:alpha-mannosidase [Chitinophaga sp. LS1]|uniref:alpha-mannosidase n=1 Tax=Chitinophaga sp. LS1 TaxID=3051176 RepID=UPI002AAB597B|nr:glycoside hydrolase family 38 C-terminal domain-containing protein [Chitinophaga sp. LS1]WPV68048.1 glycoside hydrolase family 38 C-terminal domain-containing protein [Chitinophaga sp. LS1]
MKKQILIFAGVLCFTCLKAQTKYNIAKDKVLYTIGYSHLDTEWNWDYPQVINEYIKSIMTENFPLFEKYPDYAYNFTGSRRYHMMKEYYPDLYQQVKYYIAKGRWHVSGSSVDEAETVMSTPESILRQVLYGNNFFQQEFGVVSQDYMLPDCFGFPASLPTVLRHAGLIGFSTQKLTWGSAVGIPFNIGTWYGPDGSGLVSALNGGAYVSHVPVRLDLDEGWSKRLENNRKKSGYAFDFHYYGVGDQGGAPRENDVKHAEGSLNNPDSKLKVVLTSSDQIFKDITPEIQRDLPTYKGELLLTEHSAGSITSQAFMKKMNRKNELLAKAAEQLAVVADYKGAAVYPFNKLNNAWELVLGSQVHDVLPGTSIPKAYEYAWNDEYVAANGFAAVLENSMKALAKEMDTRVKGRAVVVYNPLAIEREDVVAASVVFDKVPEGITVYGPDGVPVKSQVLQVSDHTLKFIFQAKVPSVGLAVYDVRSQVTKVTSGLKVTDHSLENEFYKVQISADGNIASIYDKVTNHELLSNPAVLDFQSEKSYTWPAWNMDWDERQKPPFDHLDKSATLRVVENGPLRIAVAVSRKGLGSQITQILSLAAGSKRLEIDNLLDWQSKGVSLKAAFPLTAVNDSTTYNMGVGTIARPRNNEKAYEAPSNQWFDQTDKSGQFGVSILEDCKYGSDKPNDTTLRLTLLFTPKPDKRYVVQGTQDWGRHAFKYGIYAHAGDWRKGLTPWQGQALNQPLMAFETDAHAGKDGKQVAMLTISTPQIGLMAFKKMEHSDDYYIVRLNELLGIDTHGVTVQFSAGIADAYEVNGQEKRIGPAKFDGQHVFFDMGHDAIKSFAVKFAPTVAVKSVVAQAPVSLPFNVDAFSYDNNRDDGNLKGRYSLPAELLPDTIVSEDVAFKMGSRADEDSNAVICKGQEIVLPDGDYNAVYLLAVADKDTVGDFRIDDHVVPVGIQEWTGYIGQYYNRRFEQDEITVKSIADPFVKKDNIAWFASHRHLAYPSKNEAYNYSYMFKYRIAIPAHAKRIKLPENKNIKIFAITVVKETAKDVVTLQPLYDDFSYKL